MISRRYYTITPRKKLQKIGAWSDKAQKYLVRKALELEIYIVCPFDQFWRVMYGIIRDITGPIKMRYGPN